MTGVLAASGYHVSPVLANGIGWAAVIGFVVLVLARVLEQLRGGK